MSAVSILQERLQSCCRDGLEPNDDGLSRLNDVLADVARENRKYLIDAEDASHRAPLFLAVESSKPLAFLQRLLDARASVTSRILICAIRYGNLDTLKLFHRYGADFRQSYYGLSLLHECILLHKNNLISFLIEEGGVSAADSDHRRASFSSARSIPIVSITIVKRRFSTPSSARMSKRFTLCCATPPPIRARSARVSSS